MDALNADPALAAVIEEHGDLAIEPHPDPFERLAISIINQQLSTASAAAIRERVFDRYEITPAGLLAADEAGLREAGLSRQKIEYLRNVATAFAEDGLRPETLEGMSDAAVVEELTAIRGVGVWTAKMFLIFSLAREDVFPVEDLGIRRGMERLYGEMTRPEMVAKAEEWRPYRSVASLYLWRAVD